MLAQGRCCLKKADFDHRSRAYLIDLLNEGGIQKVEEALNTISTGIAHKSRQSVNSWPAYLLALLKKYQNPPATNASAPPRAAAEGAAGVENSKEPQVSTPSTQIAPPRLPRDPAELSEPRGGPAASWATLDQESRQATATQAGGGEEEIDDWPVRKALRQGKIVEALDLVDRLPEVSNRVGSRVLTALGRTSNLSEEVMDKLLDLAGRFRADALETAAAEAQQRNDTAACGRLYQVAGLLSIPKTPQALARLLEGQVADPGGARAMVEEVVAEDSHVELTDELAQALAAVCAAAKDADLTAAVKRRAEAAGLSVD
eukprot:TRINITY_DN14202_c0_g3_i1.p1 TRINITY_DN14202_c0_g3~~TRINITY_DN14202_c0_g3_i1.p1  ORF type:complete len:316 (+),score=78.59 TRINITY_DN14202_c0_g3_i1:626-1573(+)